MQTLYQPICPDTTTQRQLPFGTTIHGEYYKKPQVVTPRDRRQSPGTLPLTPTSTTRANDGLSQFSWTKSRIIRRTYLPSSL